MPPKDAMKAHRQTLALVIAALTALIGAGRAGAAPVALATSAHLHVETTVELYRTEIVGQSNDWQAPDPLMPVSIGARAFQEDLQFRGRTAEVWSAIEASFESAARGRFSTEFHWDLRNAPNPAVGVGVGSGFSYTFRVDRDSVFRLDGDIDNQLTGVPPGLEFTGLVLALTGGVETPAPLAEMAAPVSSGFHVNREWQLAAGGTYTLAFGPCCGFLGFGGTHRADFASRFNWEIVEIGVPAVVPVPASGALSIAGLLALAAASRGRGRRPQRAVP